MASYFEGNEAIGEYIRLRNVLKMINRELMNRLPQKTIMECAKKLGLAKSKILVFNNPNETSVLIDYCIYCFRTGGKTVIERHAGERPPPTQADERTVLAAMVASYFSVFMVRRVYKGRGVLLYDFFKKHEVILMDIGLGDSAVLDMAFAGRILPFADFHMSAGAFLPLFELPVIEVVAPIMEKWRLSHPNMHSTWLSPGLEVSFSAQIIRAALRAGALDSANYSDIPG
ncbi:MAG: hypothetical protein P4L43_04680 [Syntrophobacteraceae bacterium]|nr:hypothetical protein [Syntrophobacteraceae bacterium]